MSHSKNLLVEVGTEELPINLVKDLSIELTSNIIKHLQLMGLRYDSFESFSSLRRLAVIIKDIGFSQDSLNPIAPKDVGAPPIEQLESQITERSTSSKTSEVVTAPPQPNETTLEIENLLSNIIQESLQLLSKDHAMRWGLYPDSFVRPPKWLVALLDTEVIPCSFLNISAGRVTYGHSIHKNTPIALGSANDYEQKLMYSGYVIASFEARKQRIRDQLQHQASQIAHSEPLFDEELLNTVAASVEWPVALTTSFNEQYLNLPSQIFQKSIHSFGNCFCMKNEQGDFLPNIILVTGFESQNPSQVIAGYKKSIESKLIDASFTLEQQKAKDDHDTQNVESHSSQTLLEPQVLHEGLIETVKSLALYTNTPEQIAYSIARLSLLDTSNIDLNNATELKAFIEQHINSDDLAVDQMQSLEAIMRDIGLFYQKDIVPKGSTSLSIILFKHILTSLEWFTQKQQEPLSELLQKHNDKLSSLLNSIINQKLPINLLRLIGAAIKAEKQVSPTIQEKKLHIQLLNYWNAKLQSIYIDAGIPRNIVKAVQARHIYNLTDFNLRILALSKLAHNEPHNAMSLASVNSRIKKLISNHKLDNTEKKKPGKIKRSLLEDESEKKLLSSTLDISKQMNLYLEQSNYDAILSELAKLTPKITSFIDKTLKVEKGSDDKLLNNRLNLLTAVHRLSLSVADLSYLTTNDS